jgi:hypothetical protein
MAFDAVSGKTYENSNRLSFSSNGAGVQLQTKYGALNFSTVEFRYYQHLFTIADSASEGALRINGSNLLCLLIRCNIVWNIVEKALVIVALNGDKKLQLNQWLVLCKLLAYHQSTKRAMTSHSFKDIHTTSIIIPLLDFNLCPAQHAFTAGKCYKAFLVRVVGWQLYGEGYPNQFAKFQLSVRSSLIREIEGFSQPLPAESASSGEHEELLVERRYSEFEAFVAVLQRSYKGLVVPPLPVKNWMPVAPSEPLIQQRSLEFQMFLDDLCAHPVLKCSFELQAFLQASSGGLKAFQELYEHLRSYSCTSPEQERAVQLISEDGRGREGVSGLLSSAQDAVAQSKAMDFLSSMWGSVSQKLYRLGAAASGFAAYGAEERGAFSQAQQTLDHVHYLGKRLDRLMQDKATHASEMLKIGQALKAVSLPIVAVSPPLAPWLMLCLAVPRCDVRADERPGACARARASAQAVLREHKWPPQAAVRALRTRADAVGESAGLLRPLQRVPACNPAAAHRPAAGARPGLEKGGGGQEGGGGIAAGAGERWPSHWQLRHQQQRL